MEYLLLVRHYVEMQYIARAVISYVCAYIIFMKQKKTVAFCSTFFVCFDWKFICGNIFPHVIFDASLTNKSNETLTHT